MPFLRQFQHLLPDSLAWRLTVQKTLRRFFEGLSSAGQDAREFVDEVWVDIFPSTTRELAQWEIQFGLVAPTAEAARRTQIAAAWAAQGGQSPRYLQDTLQAAGFPVFIHEWWDPAEAPFQQVQCGEPLARCGEPRAEAGLGSFRRFVRDPRAYTQRPVVGTVQCGDTLSKCGEPSALANAFLANQPGYLVNDTLTDVAPPGVSDDPLKWRYFLYWGGQTFPNRVVVDYTRRAECERLLLKLCPAQQWLVTLIDFFETKAPVRMTTVAALPSSAREGNFLTANANGAAPLIDGVAPVVGDRMLLRHGADGSDNGIYIWTSLGSAGSPFALIRAADFDTDADLKYGAVVPVLQGTLNAGRSFKLTTPLPVILNTTPLAFALI